MLLFRFGDTTCHASGNYAQHPGYNAQCKAVAIVQEAVGFVLHPTCKNRSDGASYKRCVKN